MKWTEAEKLVSQHSEDEKVWLISYWKYLKIFPTLLWSHPLHFRIKNFLPPNLKCNIYIVYCKNLSLDICTHTVKNKIINPLLRQYDKWQNAVYGSIKLLKCVRGSWENPWQNMFILSHESMNVFCDWKYFFSLAFMFLENCSLIKKSVLLYPPTPRSVLSSSDFPNI